MTQIRNVAVFVTLALLLGGCAQRVGSPTPILAPFSGYVIATRFGLYIAPLNAKLAIKTMEHGETFLSVRRPRYEWGIGIGNVFHVSLRQLNGESAEIALSSLPVRHDPASGSLIPKDCPQPLITNVEKPQGAHPMCSGGSNCAILDGSCVNINGDCVTSDPCGDPSPTGSGAGTGRIYFPVGGAHCNIDFTDDYVDCFEDLTGGNSNPPNIFAGWSHTATLVTETCNLNLLPAGVSGVSYGHYFDASQQVYGFRAKGFAAGGGEIFWQYPTDFQAFGQTPPPGPTVTISVNYYKYGLPFYSFFVGNCDHTG